MTNEHLKYYTSVHGKIHEFTFYQNSIQTAEVLGDLIADIWQSISAGEPLLLFYDVRASGHLPVYHTHSHFRKLEEIYGKRHVVAAFVSYPNMLDNMVRGLMMSNGYRVRFFYDVEAAENWLKEMEESHV